MNWFRSNIRHGSRLALLAFAIQFVLAFGHHHGALARAAAPGITGHVFEQSTAGNEADQIAGDLCAICAVVALAKSGISAQPPVLPTPDAVALVYRAIDTGLSGPDLGCAAFQPRAPPTV